MTPKQCGPGALAGATEANHCVIATTCSPDSAAGQASVSHRDNSDSITILHARGRRLTKVVSADGSITDYDSARLYDLRAIELASLETIESLLRRLAKRPDCCIVRGGIADPSRTRKVRRLLHHDRKTGDPPTLRDEPRHWLALDIDSVPRPEEIAPRDLAACARIAITTLPRDFHTARCIVQATASHGLKPGIRLRLWYWLTRRVATGELRYWLRGSPVDYAVFSPAQITYTAAPLFAVGAGDPMTERLLPLPGDRDCVVVPAAAVLTPPGPAMSSWRGPPSGDPGAARHGFVALAAATARVARAPDGQRHPTLLAEARGLAGLVTRRLLPERVVTDALAAAAAMAGLPDGRDRRSYCLGARAPAECIAMSEDRAAADAIEIARLAALPPLEYERERESAAERLGCRVSILDRLIEGARDGGAASAGQGRPVVIDDVEPWPEPVNGAAMLDEFIRALQQYVVISQRQADAAALWVLHTYAGAAFDVAPYLWLRSAERRSGKTRFIGILQRVVRRPLGMSGINAAALLRLIELHAPTVLLDELDTLFKGDRELAEAVRGILNSGFDRAGAAFIKNVPTPDGGWDPRAFSTYGPKVLSGIGELPATVADRSIVIDMMRKRRDQKVKRLRARDGGEFHEIARKMARWAGDNMSALSDADPAVPEELNDRAADAWVPPLAIADAIGGGWPRRAREAAIELSGEETDTQSHGEQLLADIRDAFAEKNADRLSSDELVAYLVRLEGRPWPEFGKSRKALTKNGLAALLRPFKIRSGSIRLDDGRTPKGYHRRAFEDAFARYLSVAPVRNATSPQASISTVSSAFQNATDGNGVAIQNREIGSVSEGCGGVAFSEPRPDDDDEFGERAGIIEFDGGYSRAEAEQRARAEICCGAIGLAIKAQARKI